MRIYVGICLLLAATAELYHALSLDAGEFDGILIRFIVPISDINIHSQKNMRKYLIISGFGPHVIDFV